MVKEADVKKERKKEGKGRANVGSEMPGEAANLDEEGDLDKAACLSRKCGIVKLTP